MTDETTTQALDAEVIEPTASEAAPLPPDAMKAELDRARKDAAKYRERLRQIEEKAKEAEAERLKNAPLEERLKALEAERETLAQAAAQAAETAQRERALRTISSKVHDPEAALVVAKAKGFMQEDGTVNLDEFLKAMPYFAAEQPAAAKPTAPAPMGAPAGATGRKYTADDLRRMTPEQINAVWNQITGK